MPSDPTYLLWTPRIQRGPATTQAEVRVNVTSYAAGRFPSGPAAFFAQLLTDMGLDVPIASWTVVPYRSSYHTDPDPAASWTDRWKLNWLVSLTVETEYIEELRRSVSFEEGYETWAYVSEEAFHEADPIPDPVHCLVIADFPSKDAADQAATGITKLIDGHQAAAAQADAPLRPEIFDVERSFWQMQVNLGRFPASFFQDDAPLARAVEAQCRNAGGWPTFEERIRVLG